MSPTRRTLIRTLGGLATAGVAGCSSGDSSSTATPETDATPSDGPLPRWARWAPAPGEFGRDRGYAVLSSSPRTIASYSDALPASATSWMDRDAGLGFGKIQKLDRITRVAGVAQVYRGDVDRDGADSWLGTRGLSQVGTVQGFDVYTTGNQDPADAVGVGADAVVAVRTRMSPIDANAREVLDAVIDRDRQRLFESAPGVATALEQVGDGASVAVRENVPDSETVDGAAAEGYSWALGTDRTDVTAAFVGSESVPSRAAVQSWAQDSDMFPGTEPTVTANGSLVRAAGAVPTGQVSAFVPDWTVPDSGGETTPELSFSFDYSQDAELLTATHAGGDTVDPANLYLRGEGFADVEAADQTAAGAWQGSVSDSGITAGDSVTVGVTPDYSIRIVYDDGDLSATLAVDSGPMA